MTAAVSSMNPRGPSTRPQSSAESGSPRRAQRVLYVMSDHPSISQTFVVTEAAAIGNLGTFVSGYALRKGQASRPAASIDLVLPPPSNWRLLSCIGKAPVRIFKTIWSTKPHRLSLSEVLRVIFAEAHAEYVWPSAERFRPDHVHAHFLGRQADVAQALARRLGCSWTATAHAADAFAPSEPALFSRRMEDISGVACASLRVDRAIKSHPAGKAVRTRVIRCGVNVSRLSNVPAVPPTQGHHVVTIGRLVATKGHWTTLEAASRALAQDPGLRWTIVGGGELYARLRADPRYVAAQPRLTVTGPLDHDEALKVLAQANAFVLPCEPDDRGDSDGIPVALMEAMALCIPVITTEIGGIPELVADRETGFVVPPGDPERLLEVVWSVLYRFDRNELAEVSRHGRDRVISSFNAEVEAQKLVRFLDETVRRAARM